MKMILKLNFFAEITQFYFEPTRFFFKFGDLLMCEKINF